MRNYANINKYLDELKQDIYPQPFDENHLKMAHEVLDEFLPLINAKRVLDVGCGDGFLQSDFEKRGNFYVGITIGDDVPWANKPNIQKMDFNFLDYSDDSFDLIFARHVLEHSPMPLLSLMEWHRVSKYLILVVPCPGYWGYIGRNHYHVMDKQQVNWLLRRAGWKVTHRKYTTEEYRYLCMALPRISCEGWAEVPLDVSIYETDRDM